VKIFVYDNICHVDNLVEVMENTTNLCSSTVQLSSFMLLVVTVVC